MYHFSNKANWNLCDSWVWQWLENYVTRMISFCWETACLILKTEWSKYSYSFSNLKQLLALVLPIFFKSRPIVNNHNFIFQWLYVYIDGLPVDIYGIHIWKKSLPHVCCSAQQQLSLSKLQQVENVDFLCVQPLSQRDHIWARCKVLPPWVRSLRCSSFVWRTIRSDSAL